LTSLRDRIPPGTLPMGEESEHSGLVAKRQTRITRRVAQRASAFRDAFVRGVLLRKRRREESDENH